MCDQFPQHIEVDKRMPPYGYKRPLTYKKNSSMSPSEAITIVLADRYLESILPRFNKNMSPYLDEAKEVLDETYSKKYKDWNSKVNFSNEQFSLIPAKIDPEILMKIHLAILESKDLHLDYISRKKNSKKIKFNVIPVGVAHRERLSYLLGYFPDGDMCYLPLHRIKACKTGDKIFESHKFLSLIHI